MSVISRICFYKVYKFYWIKEYYIKCGLLKICEWYFIMSINLGRFMEVSNEILDILVNDLKNGKSVILWVEIFI